MINYDKIKVIAKKWESNKRDLYLKENGSNFIFFNDEDCEELKKYLRKNFEILDEVDKIAFEKYIESFSICFLDSADDYVVD